MRRFHMPLPPEVKSVLRRLEEAGHTAYVVGGAVRDAVMGKRPHDYDITTSALPEEMKQVFDGENVVETGLKHGTLTLVGKEGQYEITTYRTDGDYIDHRHPAKVLFVDNIEADLSRRDFTVNAMAYNEKTGLLDPFGGEEDVKNGCIRCVGAPEKRFDEDALRILRGIRFAAKTGFSIEKNTANAMFLQKELLKKVSPERQNGEFSRLLTDADASLLLEFKDIFAVFIPELIPTFDFDQRNYHHRYDVYEHSARATAEAPRELILRLALFFHDIGKPAVFTVDEKGVGHFYDHAKKSRELTEAILRRLKYDNETIRTVTALVEAHGLVPHDSMKFARRLLARHGEIEVFRLITVARCDLSAQADHDEKNKSFEMLSVLEENITAVLADAQCFTVKKLAINGNDLKALGIKEGKRIGETLSFLLEKVLDDPTLNQAEPLLLLAREHLDI